MNMDFKQAHAMLKEGNERFVSGKLSLKECSESDRIRLCAGQHPFAVVLCCSDSRVAPEILFDPQLYGETEGGEPYQALGCA